jgi:hypothetical protein
VSRQLTSPQVETGDVANRWVLGMIEAASQSGLIDLLLVGEPVLGARREARGEDS